VYLSCGGGQVHEIIRRHDEELERSRTSITESFTIKPLQCQLLGVLHFVEQMRPLFPHVTIEPKPAEKKVLLQGPASDVTKVRRDATLDQHMVKIALNKIGLNKNYIYTVLTKLCFKYNLKLV
jgi:type II secretory pathway component GspD/PulD (secretin)